MAEFKESEHPRDEDGKFTENGKTEYRQNTSYSEILRAEKNKWSNKPKIEKINKKNKYDHSPDIYYNYKKNHIAGVAKGNKMTFEQADNGHCNPFYNKVEGYDTNCQTCAAVYIARRLGYNVRALPNYGNDNIRHLAGNTNMAYLDADGWHPESDFEITNKQHDFLNNTLKNGEIYSVVVGWRDSDDRHIVIAEKDLQGTLFVYDPQNNKTYKGKDINKFFTKTKDGIEYTNLTDVSMDEKFCDKVMKKAD